MNNLIEVSSQTIKSTELVDIINDFRKQEGNTKILQHYDFMKKIKKELETLKNLGIGGQGNFSESSYINSQNKKQPCFELTRDGMLEMLNSESAFVRYKTIEYINKLEKKIKQSKETVDPYSHMSKELKAILMLDTKQQAFDNRLLKVENNMTIDHAQQERLREKGQAKILKFLGGKGTPAYQKLNKKAYSQFWNDYKRYMQVPSYRDTAVKEMDKGYKFIEQWKPTELLELAIKGANSQMRM